MQALTQLKSCQSRIDLAILLNCKPSYLTYLLYKRNPTLNYEVFDVPKKNGGTRKICAPTDELKTLQRNLSDLLLDCIDNINEQKKIRSTLAHGFVRDRSIITNAEMHKNSKNVLNIDLEDFFGSFNFGRVRGFFISNRNFQLCPDVATTIAQIACYNNELPQGSPCSPVITNLISHVLDIRLAKLAKKHSCTYTRYADDITFSTRLKIFPPKVMDEPSSNQFSPSSTLVSEISRAGFKINSQKTRIQYKDSRQDVTGLIVNKKVGVKTEYRRTAKAMCNSLFHTGTYTKIVRDEHVEGSLKELEGRLNFIDSVDLYNRLKYPEKLSVHYVHRKHGFKTRPLLTGREKLLSKFLFYKLFVGNLKTTILCEGKTDNIYIKSALSQLAGSYPKLAATTAAIPPKIESLIEFVNYTKRTRFLLEIFGGTSYLAGFIGSYAEHYSFYKAPKSDKPIIIVLDNDDGLSDITKALAKIDTCNTFPQPTTKPDIKKDIKTADFIHVCHNLYIVLTPLDKGKDTMIEHLFEPALWSTPIKGRTFDPTEKKTPKQNFYGKNTFATEVVSPKRNKIKMDGFKPLLSRMTLAIEHYKKP